MSTGRNVGSVDSAGGGIGSSERSSARKSSVSAGFAGGGIGSASSGERLITYSSIGANRIYIYIYIIYNIYRGHTTPSLSQ